MLGCCYYILCDVIYIAGSIFIENSHYGSNNLIMARRNCGMRNVISSSKKSA